MTTAYVVKVADSRLFQPCLRQRVHGSSARADAIPDQLSAACSICSCCDVPRPHMVENQLAA